MIASLLRPRTSPRTAPAKAPSSLARSPTPSVVRWARSSLTVKLAVLVGLFVGLPLLVYSRLESADRKLRDLISSAIEHQSWLIAQALKPILDQPGKLPIDLAGQLRNFSGDNTILKLMLSPRAGERHFYYVASAPAVGPDRIDADLDNLRRQGILNELSPSCAWQMTTEVRNTPPGSNDEILTSIVPIESRWGCWVLIASHSTAEFRTTAIGEPYWREPQVQVAFSIYLVMAALSVVIAASVWRNLFRFRRVALTLRHGWTPEHSFSAQNDIPELARVAAVCDQLVADLHRTARDIRRAAEDNAHSFKTPLATIDACLGALRLAVDTEDARAGRALVLMSSSLERMKALVWAAQRLDNIEADMIEAPRVRVDLAEIVDGVLPRYRELAARRAIRLAINLSDPTYILANREALEIVVENILDNAISFTSPGGTVEVSLTRRSATAELCVLDDGPGIDPDKIDRIFERYFSLRPRRNDEADGGHAGLGLWIVRRHVEALGGAVTATNRETGGMCIVVALPARS